METKAALAPEMVQEFVGVAHGSLERVQELLAQEPALLHAAWDWGGGDWETALGAASHVGRRDIALFLLAQGAHLDIFAAAMLGHLSLVKAIIDAQPEAKHSLGPHGIPLLVHAQMGGAQAAAVADYLQPQARFKAVYPIGDTDPRALPVADIDTAVPFYTEKLGFSLRERSPGPPRSVTLLRDDIEIVLSETGADPQQASCVWSVSDIDAAYAEYKAQGLDVSPEISPMAHGGNPYRVFFLKDPDGLCYCLSQPAPIPDPHGFQALQPVLPVADLPAALAYYTEKLGFTTDFTWGDPPTYAALMRGHARLHLYPSDVPFAPSGAVYITVAADVDGLCDTYRTRGVAITRAPATYPYGMREFSVADLNGHRLLFGMEAVGEP